MVTRINLLLQAKNITARQFAEEIGIQPSGMSHILSGRNNPSLDFVMKVIRRWPEININWLMFGKGEMFSGVPQPSMPESQPSTVVQRPSDESQTSDKFDLASSVQAEPDLFSQLEEPQQNVIPAQFSESVQKGPTPPPAPARNAQLNENRPDESVKPSAPVQPSIGQKRVVKMIVLYDDYTFSEYRPA